MMNYQQVKGIVYSTLLVSLLRPGLCIQIPNSGRYYKDYGILIEPDNLALYYDSNAYITIGLHDNLINLDYPSLNKCPNTNLVHDFIIRLKGLQLEYTSFMSQLPDTLYSLKDHYCTDGTIDCFIQQHKKGSTGSSYSIHDRPKRTPVLAIAVAIGGIIAAGLAIMNAVNNYKLRSMIDQIQNNQNRISTTLDKDVGRINSFEKISKDFFLNIDHSLKDLIDHLSADLCELNQKSDMVNIFFSARSYLATKKQNILRMLDGKISPDVLNSMFLYDHIVNHPMLDKTIYLRDPGMFYLLANSFFLNYDKDKQIAYFLISIPIVYQSDISPIFSIYNIGYLQNEIYHKLDIPKKIYFVSGKDTFHAVDFQNEDCQMNSGIYLCSTRHKTITSNTKCIQDIITGVQDKDCGILVSKDEKFSSVITTKGGVIIQGDHSVSKINAIRHGFIRSDEHTVLYNTSLFIPYSEFNTLKIDDMMIRSLETHINIEVVQDHLPDTFVLSDDLKEFLAPSRFKTIEDLEELKNLKPLESVDPTFDQVVTTVHPHVTLILLFLSLVFLILISYLYVKLRSTTSRAEMVYNCIHTARNLREFNFGR